MKKQYMRKLLFSIAFLCAMFSNAQTATENQPVTENDLNVVLQSIVNKLDKLKRVQEELTLIKKALGIMPFVNGHECVDLGLSVKWATMNVGATEVAGSKKNSHTGKLDCYGEYYAWGETSPKDTYNFSTYTLCEGTYNTMTKYCNLNVYGHVDNKYTLEPSDDAALANWGGTWRMPTSDEQKELVDNCYWEWTTSYNDTGVKGYIVYKVKDVSDKGIKKYSGSSTTTSASYSLSDTHIFLPASGLVKGSTFKNVGSSGYCWSSSLGLSDSFYASIFAFNSGKFYWDYFDRYYGLSVRAVCP